MFGRMFYAILIRTDGNKKRVIARDRPTEML